MSKPSFNPETLNIDSVAGEAAVPAQRLNADWLRARFADPPAWTPEHFEEPMVRLRGREPTPAAVLMPLILRDQGMTLLLTQRTAHLNDHAGQVSLPGGRVDEGDSNAVETALRETEEEVGLHRRHIEVLGSLPDYVTGTGFRVTPVVALAHPPFELNADPFEVAEIFEVPLAYMLDGHNHQRRSVDFPGAMGRRSFYTMPYGRYFVWGATAGMLRNLFHFLRA